VNIPRMAIHTATGEASRVYSISLSDNDGIPMLEGTLCDGSGGMLHFIVCCLLFAHDRSDDRQPKVIFCWNSTENCESSSVMLSKKLLLYIHN